MLLILLGCASSKQTPEVSRPTSTTEAVTPNQQKNRQLALQHFVDGSIYDLKEDYAKAVLEYQDALRYDADPAVYYALSKDYSRLGKHYLATENAKAAVHLDPKNISYRLHLAEVYLAAREVDSSLREYKNVLQIDSNRTEALYATARLQQQLGRPLEAIGTYKKLLDRTGPDWGILFQLSQLYEGLQRYEDAVDVYQQMVALDPSNLELKKRVIEIYLRSSKPDSALVRLNELLDVDRTNPDFQVLVGDVYLEKNDLAKSLEHYNEVLKMDSVGAETRLHIGEALLQHSQKDSTSLQYAKPILEKLRHEMPSDWRPYWYLGFVAFAERNDPLALGNFRKVAELNTRNADAWFYVGTIYYRMQQYDSAASALEKSVEMNPKNVDALGSLALTYDTMKRHEDSDRIYEQGLKLDQQNDVLLNNYSYSLAERGIQLERALKMAKEALQKRPENSSYLDTMGWIYFKLGKYEDARRYIEKAVELRDAVGENGATLNEHLGDVYFKMNDKEKAMEYWKRALKMNEKNESLKKKIDRGTIE